MPPEFSVNLVPWESMHLVRIAFEVSKCPERATARPGFPLAFFEDGTTFRRTITSSKRELPALFSQSLVAFNLKLGHRIPIPDGAQNVTVPLRAQRSETRRGWLTGALGIIG